MTAPLYLARVRLRRDAALASLAALLLPEGAAGRRAATQHRLVWSLFADDPGRTRDFLWREEGPGRWMTLSRRPPADSHALFDLDCKPFEPVLSVGDRLRFSLRANPVIARKGPSSPPGGRERGRRHDVVMDAIHAVPPGARSGAREAAIGTAGAGWLARQGTRAGFTIDPVALAVDGYDRLRVPRDEGAAAEFGVLDFDGVLSVTDPAKFLVALGDGFGRARAFGCGLMLIRRATA